VPEILSLLLGGLSTTLSITLGALVIGVLVSVPLAMLRRAPVALVPQLVGLVIELIRAVPPIVWVFIVYYSVGSSPALMLEPEVAAAVGLGVIASAYFAEIYRGAVAAIPAGQHEAVAALAVPRRIAYAKVLIPQSLVLVIAPVTSYAVSLLKDSALASVIGAQDVTFLAFQQAQLTLDGLQTFGVAGAIYLALSLLIAWGGTSLDRWIHRRVFDA
jgi:polar amino acid transport system permease protein